MPFLPMRFARIKSLVQHVVLANLWGNRHHHTWQMEVQNDTALLRGIWQYLQNCRSSNALTQPKVSI